MLHESYEQSYGIFDHNSPGQTPLSVVTMHPTEKYAETTGLYNLFARYLKHPIKERFGLNLIQFISLPREYTEELFRLSEIGAAAANGTSAAELRRLEEELRKSAKL